jgi:aminomethyltransferase
VTSGTSSPTLKKSIAMALVGADAQEGEAEVEVRGKKLAAAIVKLPFYKRPAAKQG